MNDIAKATAKAARDQVRRVIFETLLDERVIGVYLSRHQLDQLAGRVIERLVQDAPRGALAYLAGVRFADDLRGQCAGRGQVRSDDGDDERCDVVLTPAGEAALEAAAPPDPPPDPDPDPDPCTEHKGNS